MTSNPFVNIQLRIPDMYRAEVQQYTATFRDESGNPSPPDYAPFRRYVDLWWLAMCLGIQEESSVKAAKWHNFVTGAVLNEDHWRIRQLQLIAIGATEDPYTALDPGEIIRIANEFAAGGLPILLDKITGPVVPIWEVSELIQERATVS